MSIAPTPVVIPLHCLRSGETAAVEAICGDAAHVHRLRELGLQDGQEIEMLQSGSPCIIRLGGQRLCFRSDDVTSVLVRTGSTG
ncbi:MAG: FeoA family protein [Planctomycetia bacterium]|nr:FeoA family protein [Planctomycetia bacterium]